ncbi:hypothetical protein Afil01_29340 [Actinorhabdospora filicis]|uniref:Uncharacterized protein n=1 Tax=Actinorhabdospora filicis TaxID=1785913 RepID=A0A9W6W3G5_9ACTN|nr:hypothetical protein [Actinorhabdospora filicis]GLZ78127.1 hypothetical protein Afil01_29340 [Actinorhabdospora filicis]
MRTLHGPKDYLELARAPGTPPEELARLAAADFPFVWRALAERPDLSTELLRSLARRPAAGWNGACLLGLIARHPNADREALLIVLAATADLLGRGERPYAVALALARRIELPAGEVSVLGGLAGASRRFRRGLRRALAH